MGRISTLGDILSNFEVIFLQVLLALTVLFSLTFFFFQFSNVRLPPRLADQRICHSNHDDSRNKENYCDALYFIIYWLKTKDFIEWRSGQIIVPFRTEMFLLVCGACILEPNAWVPIREVYWH